VIQIQGNDPLGRGLDARLTALLRKKVLLRNPKKRKPDDIICRIF
jgi:hypothetical protein